jgi:hypothetical protein
MLPKITKIDMYLDGGTRVIFTDQGNFYIDKRIKVWKTDSEGKVYTAYPDKPEAKLVENIELIAFLKEQVFDWEQENIRKNNESKT